MKNRAFHQGCCTSRLLPPSASESWLCRDARHPMPSIEITHRMICARLALRAPLALSAPHRAALPIVRSHPSWCELNLLGRPYGAGWVNKEVLSPPDSKSLDSESDRIVMRARQEAHGEDLLAARAQICSRDNYCRSCWLHPSTSSRFWL